MSGMTWAADDGSLGLPDPAPFAGPGEKRSEEFMNVARTLKRRIELMLALPIHRRDAIAIQRQVRNIGKQ
jgi:arsenate reductase